MSDQQPIESAVLAFLQAQCPHIDSMNVETELVESGIIDSLLMMDMIVHIESEYNVRLGAADLSPGNFRTITALAALVASKSSSMQASSHAA
jgi:acyl carrier protein